MAKSSNNGRKPRRKVKKGVSNGNETKMTATTKSGWMTIWLPAGAVVFLIVSIALLSFPLVRQKQNVMSKSSFSMATTEDLGEDETCLEDDHHNEVNEAFVKWFTENDGYLSPKVQLKQTKTSGRGLHVVGDNNSIEEGEIIIKVPMKLIKSPQQMQDKITNVLDSLKPSSNHKEKGLKALKSLQQQETYVIESTKQSYQPSSSKCVFIAMDLLFEQAKGTSSFFAPYLATLPKYVPRPSSWMKDKELMELQNNYIVQMAKTKREGIKLMWEQHVKPLMQILVDTTTTGDGDDATMTYNLLNDFHGFDRFYSLCSTHALGLEQGTHLIPMADKINFERNPNGATSSKQFQQNHLISSSDNVVTIRAERTFKSNSEIMEDYNDSLDLHGCLMRGMVIENDQGMRPHLVSIPVPSPLKGIAVTIQKYLGIKQRSMIRARTLEAVYDQQDWHYLSLLCLMDDDDHVMVEQVKHVRQFLMENKHNSNKQDVTFLKELERIACLYPQVKERTRKKLYDLALQAQSSLPTSLEMDRKLLMDTTSKLLQQQQQNGGGTSHAEKMKSMEHLLLALRFRIKEKEALEEFIETQRV